MTISDLVGMYSVDVIVIEAGWTVLRRERAGADRGIASGAGDVEVEGIDGVRERVECDTAQASFRLYIIAFSSDKFA